MKVQPIVMERTFRSPIEKVWQAITNKDAMKQWYFDLPAFKAEVGFEFQFEGGADPQKPYRHLCKIVEVIKNKKISYSWRYEGYPGNSLVTFELFEEGENTKLMLTHSGIESFPASNPDFASHNFAAGWTRIIGSSLKDFLEGK